MNTRSLRSLPLTPRGGFKLPKMSRKRPRSESNHKSQTICPPTAPSKPQPAKSQNRSFQLQQTQKKLTLQNKHSPIKGLEINKPTSNDIACTDLERCLYDIAKANTTLSPFCRIVEQAVQKMRAQFSQREEPPRNNVKHSSPNEFNKRARIEQFQADNTRLECRIAQMEQKIVKYRLKESQLARTLASLTNSTVPRTQLSSVLQIDPAQPLSSQEEDSNY